MARAVNKQVVIPGRLDTIREYQRAGGGIAAVFPIHYPRELLRAFDLLPVEVWGPPGVDQALGGAHLQPYVCSIVHNALSFQQSGGLDTAEVLVVPHACDSLQGLGSVLIDFIKPKQPVLPLYLPRGRRQSDLIFLTAELRALYGQLETITGRSPSDHELMASILREEQADGLVIALHQRRSGLSFSDISFYRLIRSREFLPAERFMLLAEEALSEADIDSEDGRIPILLSGIVPEPMEILNVINRAGAQVVADDLACCGRRQYPPGESSDPFTRMAERLLNSPADSTRGDSIGERRSHLIELVLNSGAKGVVFYEVKFCEPELFDLPLLRQALASEEVPVITVEVDLNEPLPERIITRLEAFVELLT
jgi:benzoyl-CoA reductase/2-hydroxyglutaryl-CoA dehydratase subunit BcrC/BadD/HgdB